jgi:ribosomal protein S18 acetylase RimI-like enzyme
LYSHANEESSSARNQGKDEHGLIGMVKFRREEGLKNHHKGRILSMFVQPESRGQGVGKALLREVIARTKGFLLSLP